MEDTQAGPQAPQGLGMFEARGLRLAYRPGTADETVLDEVVKRPGEYTNKKVRYEPGDLWLDIGAHIGSFTCRAAAAGCRVVAYEPRPANVELLRMNLELNGLEHLVEVVEAAVLAAPTPTPNVVLWASPAARSTERASIFGAGKKGWQPFDAPTVGFFDEARARAPRFIKMDAEGAEFGILDALDERIGDLASVAGMTYEYHFTVDPSRAAYWRRLQVVGRHFEVMQARDRDIREGTYRGWIDPILKVYRDRA
jgi:FkbM family methyltransferase